MIIRATNNLDVNSTYSFLSTSINSGVASLPVKNINAFNANWAVQIGKTGEETAEIVLLGTATPSGTAITTTANTRFSHPSDTPIYNIKYDQVIFSRSTTGTAGTAYDLTGGTVSITPDSDVTQIDDPQGLVTYAYKARYRNSVLGVSYDSPESDWITSTGFTFYSLAKIRERIKSKIFNSGYLKDDEQINDWINEWLEEMNNAIVNIDKSYSMGTVNVSFGTSGLGTVTSTDFKDMKRIWITYDGTNKYKATKRDTNNVEPDESFNEAHPYYIWKGDDVFQVQPPQSGGTAELEYYKRNPILVNDTDELPFAMRSYSNSFVNYGLAEAYYNDDKEEKGDRYLARANKDKQLFISEMTPRSFTGVELMDVTHSIFGDDVAYYY